MWHQVRRRFDGFQNFKPRDSWKRQIEKDQIWRGNVSLLVDVCKRVFSIGNGAEIVKPAALNASSVRCVSAGLLSTMRISICLRVVGRSRPMEGLDMSNLLSVGQKVVGLFERPFIITLSPRTVADAGFLLPCGRCLNRIATSVQNLGCWENGRNECRQALAEGAATLVGAILNKSLSELFKGHGARSFLAVRAGDARSDRRCFRALIMQQSGHKSSAFPDGPSRPAYGLIQLRPPSPSSPDPDRSADAGHPEKIRRIQKSFLPARSEPFVVSCLQREGVKCYTRVHPMRI